MSLTYQTYVDQLSNLMVQTQSDPNFVTFLPGCIAYSENRMYRELDLLATRITDNTGALTANNRNFSLPTATGTFLVVETVNVVTPVAQIPPNGTRNQLTKTSKEFIDALYPSDTTGTGVPKFFDMLDNATIVIGPAPDAAYHVQVIGTQRPTALSSTNTTTILTTMLPDAFMAASMIFATAYQRDFGSQSDDPARSASWEAEYQKLIQSAGIEEVRKKYQSQGWTSHLPSPVVTPPRV